MGKSLRNVTEKVSPPLYSNARFVNGKQCRFEGQITLPVSIGNCDYPINFHILPTARSISIIGLDFMKEYGANINIASQSLQLPSPRVPQRTPLDVVTSKLKASSVSISPHMSPAEAIDVNGYEINIMPTDHNVPILVESSRCSKFPKENLISESTKVKESEVTNRPMINVLGQNQIAFNKASNKMTHTCVVKNMCHPKGCSKKIALLKSKGRNVQLDTCILK